MGTIVIKRSDHTIGVIILDIFVQHIPLRCCGR
jgi:hypothetical protein